MKRIGLLIGAAGLLMAGTAFAGYTYWPEVYVTSNSADGSVVGAYRAADGNQEITCSTTASSTPSGSCYAYDRNNVYRTCDTTNAAQIAVMQSAGPFSYITFTVAANNYSCASVTIHNGSRFGSF